MTKNKSIQEKTAELDSLVAWFNGDDFALEDALVKFKQAETLAAEIEQDLNSIKNDIEVVKQKFDQEVA
jgi:exodeoxyribonuclease VII small subunit